MSANRQFLLIAGLAVAVRLTFVFAAPFGGGDWDIYSTVAENILRGCGVSLTPPDGTECAPHFGGNHLPGFPAFAALIWWLSGHSDVAIRIAQTMIYGAALFYLMQAVAAWHRNSTAALIVGLVMALSPLQVAWPRYTQTETLALATCIWVFAELLYSFHEQHLRILPLALALIAAVWVRVDGVLLTIPVAVAGFLIHRPVDAIRRGAVLALVFLLPVIGWTARNIHVGLTSLMPPPMVIPKNAAAPIGYLAWGSTWVAEEYQRMGWLWPVTRMVYDSISIDSRAYDSAEEKAQVEALLTELASHSGEPFPPSIDAAFAELARERAAAAPVHTYLVLPLRRALALWSSPFSSFGWPNELLSDVSHQQRLEASRGLGGAISLALTYPGRAASKAFTALYRFALLAAFVAVVALSLGDRLKPLRPLVWTVAAWVLARSAFFAATNNVETRYTVPLTPAIELVTVLALVLLFWTAGRKTPPQ